MQKHKYSEGVSIKWLGFNGKQRECEKSQPELWCVCPPAAIHSGDLRQLEREYLPEVYWEVSRGRWKQVHLHTHYSHTDCWAFFLSPPPSDKFTRFCQWKNVELNIHVSTSYQRLEVSGNTSRNKSLENRRILPSMIIWIMFRHLCCDFFKWCQFYAKGS